ncbi:MAG: redoxin domain-containing protein [Bacteroidia bacterium]|nr:redoxin domain-containing protein [Bacteroidia bacterium]
MKSYRIVLMGLCALIVASCGKPAAKINGTLEGAAQKQVVVKMLDVNTYTVLDTVKTDDNGKYSYKVALQGGQPEFVYVFYGDTKISSLLLQDGDVVTVVSDTLGQCTVEGSEESVKLQENEAKFASFINAANAAQTVGDFNKAYIQYYRDAVKYVITNPQSLTIVPVLFQNIDSEYPLFSQTTDAIHFRNAANSLKEVYPDSKYIKALEAEAKRRENLLSLDNQLANATQLSFPDIKSKDINGKEVKLSEVDAKAILVRFWTVGDADAKMFNVDNLMPLYEKYHQKGLEIFAVSLDTDKAAWASVVKSQNLPWINVNDGMGLSSRAVTLYNLATLPQNFLIIDGEIYDKEISGDKALAALLDKSL